MSTYPEFRESWSFKNRVGLNVTMYNELPCQRENIEKAILLVHGLQSHYELEYCAELVPKDDTFELKFNTSNSWSRKLHSMPGLAVYGIDNQGHGASESWKHTRTNVETFDDYSEDIIQALREIASRHSQSIPICLVGISLGGAICARTLELIGQMKEEPGFNLHTCVLLAPALSIEMLKAKPMNKIAVPFAPIVSHLAPSLKVGTVENHPKYPMIDEYKLSDKKAGQGKIPARLSAETIKICETVERDIKDIGKNNPNLRVHFIHSEADGFVDPDGSRKTFQNIDLKHKELTILKEETGMWHYLTLEVGTATHVLSIVEEEAKLMNH